MGGLFTLSSCSDFHTNIFLDSAVTVFISYGMLKLSSPVEKSTGLNNGQSATDNIHLKREKRNITKNVWRQACRANIISSSIFPLSQTHHIKVCRLQREPELCKIKYYRCFFPSCHQRWLLWRLMCPLVRFGVIKIRICGEAVYAIQFKNKAFNPFDVLSTF